MQKRQFHSNPPGLTLFIPDYSEFIGGRWVNHRATYVNFNPTFQTDSPEIIKAIRSSKGYGQRYFELDPETGRTTTFPVDYGLVEKQVEEDKPILVRGTSKVVK